ncbi:MAG: ergothioneine biosynthesis protein EgtB [Bacteroidetes bacterium]|nr:ergothioneine biosynthesis protein EgtB [Bacteroidota bacterium]
MGTLIDTSNNKESKISLNKKELIERFKNVRSFSEELAKPLKTEDFVIQSMPDVSPTKWHLGHVSWFFEAFILNKVLKNYKSVDTKYTYIFNSYYVLIGERFVRANRGLLSRPTVEEVFNYRKFVNENLIEFLENCSDEIFEKYAPIVEVGLNHEQQHQELLLTDIKHVLSFNPLNPVYSSINLPESNSQQLSWQTFDEGVFQIGNTGTKFCYDNETPLHKEYIQPFQLATRLVTNQEYIEFIEAGAYKKQELWLSDGWATLEAENWVAPLYWKKIDGKWWHFTLTGLKEVFPYEPVSHVSYYEAEAYSRWADGRLPTEAEWEVAADNIEIEGNFVDDRYFHPITYNNSNGIKLSQIYGDVWEWTQSAYLPYPGYKPLPGALGEYNGKFMSGQMVLRGGSCATYSNHIRKTYRNFFPPHSRWQFMGIRLARND